MKPNGFLKVVSGVPGACLLALVVLAACNTSDYLHVTSPSRIPAGALEDPANAALLVNGAVADFECAFGSYVVVSGLIGQELDDATQTADRYPYDQRTVISSSSRYQSSGCTALGVYSPLQTARVSSDNARRLLLGWTDTQVQNRSLLLATVAANEGYAELLLGEGSCATVFSSFTSTGSVVYGTAIPPAQAFDSAIARFTDAIAAAQAAGAGAQALLSFAYDGRARARLDKGDYAGAKADATLVPAGFVYNMTASSISALRYNRVWADNGVVGAGSFNQGSSVGAYYRTMNDPRVPVLNTGKSSVTKVPIWVQTKYASSSSPIPVASGVEAQLIVAEADITTGNLAEALSILNASRASGGEGALDATSTAADLKAALIEERRRALFLQGQHLYDLIRFQLPLSPAAGTPYPGGGTYGSQLCMPLPDVETFNNPLLSGG